MAATIGFYLSGVIAFAIIFVGYHYFPWRRQPAESYSFWHGSRSLWLPFWRWPNDGPMMTNPRRTVLQIPSIN